MRTKFIIHRLLYLFIILGLTLSFNNCTSDDDEDILTQTWLEKYDGTKWEDGDGLYWRIIDNTNTILESWYHDGPCYWHSIPEGNENFEIIENSTNKLVIHVIEDGNTETVTLRINGDTLTVLFEENGESETIYLDKTSVNVDDFTLCD